MLLFKEGSRRPAEAGPASRTARDAAEADPEPERVWICRHCGHAVTRPDQGIVVDGAHRHTFANPHGVVYEIGCFHSAQGCAATGSATDEFTWFAGFFWRIAVCGRCQVHLGWRFESRAQSRFFGLIVGRLVLADDGGPKRR